MTSLVQRTSANKGSMAYYDEQREPFELIIDKNLRSRAKRAQDETKEELTKVLQRVENVNNFY
jgi:hypothetical protein